MRSPRVVRQRAVELRQQSTSEELLLWQRLRRHGLGVKARRQCPIGTFIVDFYIAHGRLVIEVDGNVHMTKRERDTERTCWLEAAGYQVVRFSNEQVLSDIDGVLAHIQTLITRSP